MFLLLKYKRYVQNLNLIIITAFSKVIGDGFDHGLRPDGRDLSCGQ